MRRSLAQIGMVIILVLIALPSVADPPYFGMTEAQYEQCIRLGQAVMAAQKRRPDSPERKTAYTRWDSDCGLEVMLPLARQHGFSGFPYSPLDWAQLQ